MARSNKDDSSYEDDGSLESLRLAALKTMKNKEVVEESDEEELRKEALQSLRQKSSEKPKPLSSNRSDNNTRSFENSDFSHHHGQKAYRSKLPEENENITVQTFVDRTHRDEKIVRIVPRNNGAEKRNSQKDDSGEDSESVHTSDLSFLSSDEADFKSAEKNAVEINRTRKVPSLTNKASFDLRKKLEKRGLHNNRNLYRESEDMSHHHHKQHIKAPVRITRRQQPSRSKVDDSRPSRVVIASRHTRDVKCKKEEEEIEEEEVIEEEVIVEEENEDDFDDDFDLQSSSSSEEGEASSSSPSPERPKVTIRSTKRKITPMIPKMSSQSKAIKKSMASDDSVSEYGSSADQSDDNQITAKSKEDLRSRIVVARSKNQQHHHHVNDDVSSDEGERRPITDARRRLKSSTRNQKLSNNLPKKRQAADSRYNKTTTDMKQHRANVKQRLGWSAPTTKRPRLEGRLERRNHSQTTDVTPHKRQCDDRELDERIRKINQNNARIKQRREQIKREIQELSS